MQCPSCKGGEIARVRISVATVTASLVDPRQGPPSATFHSVPRHNAEAYRQHQPVFSHETPPSPPARRVIAQRLCPAMQRCQRPSKARQPVWAIVLSIVTFPIFCFFSLFFLPRERTESVHAVRI
jgi:hypothetical protein